MSGENYHVAAVAYPAGVTAAAAGEEEPTDPGLVAKGYVCSVTGRRGPRRLCYIGLCHRKPGFDYALFMLLGNEVPAPENYDDVCKPCWPTGVPDKGAVKDDFGSSAATTDESSSTDNE